MYISCLLYTSYKEKIPHEIAGAQIAEKILDSLPEAVAYTEEEKKEILTAIRGHRRERKDMTKLERLLYESDTVSYTHLDVYKRQYRNHQQQTA